MRKTRDRTDKKKMRHSFTRTPVKASVAGQRTREWAEHEKQHEEIVAFLHEDAREGFCNGTENQRMRRTRERT